MSEVVTVGVDIAKNVFHVHAVDAAGRLVLQKQLRRSKVVEFFSNLAPCRVAMEACGSAHFWAREISKFGHAVQLIPPAYVKPFVKRQKNDAVDAEAICEAAQRPNMRFVPIKSEDQQGNALVFRARDLLTRQRIQIINSLRSHMAEFGIVVGQGPAQLPELLLHITEPDSGLPECAKPVLQVLVDTLAALQAQIKGLDEEINRRAREDEMARRLATVPGVGPITATALVALAPNAANFRRARDFAAWLGLTPLEHSTGGKQRLGATSKMGERTLRRLLILGACATVQHRAKHLSKDTWLGKMLARKPRMLVIVALANKMARIVWALIVKGGNYRVSEAVA
ncbi:IS110 family transposase [Asticcacaulis sp. W401b]|uniref:IS110 family transposase n=1 Tax=Asticcacaulis sp. W401b TaxID=3388666 RepID=UPI003970C6F6